MMPSVSFYHFPARGTFYGLRTLEEALSATKEDGFVWFNFFKPERNALNALIDPLGIHPLSIEDCYDEKQIPKMELFPENTFIIFNSFMYINKELFIDEIDLFIGKKFLVTVSGYNSLDREPLNNLTGVLEAGKMNIRGGPDNLMHKILDYLVDEKYKAFDILEDELEDSEELLLRDVQQYDPMQLLRIRRNLMSLRKSLFHEREILIKILRMDCPFVSAKSIVLYRDVFDHLEKFFELTETLRVIETSLMELFSSLLNNHMTKVSIETNNSMRRLTLIATIFMPLTLIASIGGMSEWTMITGQENWKMSYPLFILGMAVIAAVNFIIIRKLEKRRPPKD